MLSRRLMSRGSEACVPAAASATVSHSKFLSRSRQIDNFFARCCVVDYGSYGHRNLDALTFAPGSVAALAVPASLGRMLRVIPQMKKRVVVFACSEDDIAAPPAVAAAWPASG